MESTDKNPFSMMRLGMFCCIIIGGYLAIAGLHTDANMLELAPTILVFVGAGITGKVYQKKFEVK